MARGDRLSTEWTKHLKTQDEKEQFEKLLRNSTISLGRLRAILERRLHSLDRAEISSKVYDCPNWQYMQADSNGSKRVLKEVIELLSFTK